MDMEQQLIDELKTKTNADTDGVSGHFTQPGQLRTLQLLSRNIISRLDINHLHTAIRSLRNLDPIGIINCHIFVDMLQEVQQATTAEKALAARLDYIRYDQLTGYKDYEAACDWIKWIGGLDVFLELDFSKVVVKNEVKPIVIQLVCLRRAIRTAQKCPVRLTYKSVHYIGRAPFEYNVPIVKMFCGDVTDALPQIVKLHRNGRCLIHIASDANVIGGAYRNGRCSGLEEQLMGLTLQAPWMLKAGIPFEHVPAISSNVVCSFPVNFVPWVNIGLKPDTVASHTHGQAVLVMSSSTSTSTTMTNFMAEVQRYAGEIYTVVFTGADATETVNAIQTYGNIGRDMQFVFIGSSETVKEFAYVAKAKSFKCNNLIDI